MPPTDDASSIEAQQQRNEADAEDKIEHHHAVPASDSAPVLGGGKPATGGGHFEFDRDEVVPILKQWQQVYEDTLDEKREYTTMGRVRPLAPDEFSQQHAQATLTFVQQQQESHDEALKYIAGWIAKMYATAQSYSLTDGLSASDLTNIKSTLQREGIAVPGDKA